MNKTSATVVADSINPQGDRLTSLLITFPRILLSEINTHRMLSKNTSSSRAIPFEKMVEAVQNNPFIPIAWQKEHIGMQGYEYFTDSMSISKLRRKWLDARDNAIACANVLKEGEYDGQNYMTQSTKQLCNRLLEPFMWTTMLITGSREGWDNFHSLRNPIYEDDVAIYEDDAETYIKVQAKSKKEFMSKLPHNSVHKYEDLSDLQWLKLNKGQAEIHIMDLAEKIYDAVNESIPKKLAPNSWHIPFSNKIPFVGNLIESIDEDNTYWKDYDEQNKVKISVAMAARTSYTVVGDEKEVDYERMIQLHDRLLSQDPPHSSPLEHCARAMSDDEYYEFRKGKTVSLKRDFIASIDEIEEDIKSQGWCYNLKGFIPYRYLIDNNLI